MALFPVMSALKEFLEGPDGVLCVFGPVGCGKLTLCTQASKANGFELKPFEPGKVEGVAAVTLDPFSDVPRKVVFFWRGETLPPRYKPGGTKLFLVGQRKCSCFPSVQVPEPTPGEMRRALDALLEGRVAGPAGSDWHDSMMSVLRQRRQDAPPLTEEIKKHIVLAARNDYRQLLLHLVSPQLAECLPTRVEELKAKFQPAKERAGAPKKGVPDPREAKKLEAWMKSLEAHVLNDMLSSAVLPVVPYVGCSKCKFSARGCKECWERLAANMEEERDVPQQGLLTQKRRLPWLAVDTKAGLLGYSDSSEPECKRRHV